MSRLLPTVLILVAGIFLVLAGTGMLIFCIYSFIFIIQYYPPLSFPDDPCYEPFGSANEHDVCKAYFTRWGFDPIEKSCKEFVYGGCGANGNNFNSKEECEDKCGGDSSRNKTEM